MTSALNIDNVIEILSTKITFKQAMIPFPPLSSHSPHPPLNKPPQKIQRRHDILPPHLTLLLHLQIKRMSNLLSQHQFCLYPKPLQHLMCPFRHLPLHKHILPSMQEIRRRKRPAKPRRRIHARIVPVRHDGRQCCASFDLRNIPCAARVGKVGRAAHEHGGRG
jgi:hypothetical protein